MLLRGHAGVGAGNVDETDHREAVPVRELHRAHGLPVALGVRHPEVATRALLDVTALLIAHEHHRLPAEAAEARDHRGVVAMGQVAVELEPVLKQPLHVVERVRALRVAGELDGAPDVLVARLGDEPVQLLLQPLELA